MRYKQENFERFALNIENYILDELFIIAKSNGVTISWILRAILLSLYKKYKDNLKHISGIQRPVRFKNYYSQFSIYFYGDKSKWKNLAATWNVELGSLVRFGIDEFLSGVLEVDLDNIRTIKEAKYSTFKYFYKIKLFSSGIYLTLNTVKLYKKGEFREKNADANIKLMFFGISGRKKKRRLGKIDNNI